MHLFPPLVTVLLLAGVIEHFNACASFILEKSEETVLSTHAMCFSPNFSRSSSIICKISLVTEEIDGALTNGFTTLVTLIRCPQVMIRPMYSHLYQFKDCATFIF